MIDDAGVSEEKKLTPVAAFVAGFHAWLPYVVIAVAFGWSAWVVGARQFKNVSQSKTTIRIAHWQLEAGVRDGINEAAAEYERLHPGVKIAQEAIPESTYGQWLNVQLIGDNAPDIVEVGQVQANVMTTIYLRYLMPLTPYVTRPNPYNKGTELEGMPLQETFLDGLQTSYIDEAQEYMTLPLARMSTRLLYNKTLLKQLTGVDKPPMNYREFLKLCAQIQEKTADNGQAYSAICCSSYHYAGWNTNLILPLTYAAFRDIDFNRDGRFAKDEWSIGFMTGKIDLKHPAYQSAFTAIQELRPYFQPGWVGLTRDEAVFSFAQQKGVFIPCGLWEAGGVAELSKGQFEVGVMDFPVPDSSDPKHGALAEGPRFENTMGTIPFGITRSSPNPEIALDFLLFLASQKQNEKFNAKLHWLPIIAGAKSSPELAPYEPNLKGIFSAFDPNLGGETTIRWSQLLALFQVSQISYDNMAQVFKEFYVTKGREDFEEFLRNLRRPGTRNEQLSTSLRARAMLEPDPDKAAQDWIKYRAIQLRTVATDTTYMTNSKALTEPEHFLEQRLYKYSPEALQRIRRRAGKSAAPGVTPAPAPTPESAAPAPSSAPTPEPAPTPTPAPAPAG